MKEVTFQGALDPHTPIGQGWLRASHRKLDKKLSLPYRPYHTHDEKQPLKPGEVYELEVEIVPTSIVVPKGYRVALTVRGKDYVYPGGSGGRLSNMKNEFTGCGPFLHDDPRDRPLAIYGGKTTLHLGGGRDNFLLLPIIPEKPAAKGKAAKPAKAHARPSAKQRAGQGPGRSGARARTAIRVSPPAGFPPCENVCSAKALTKNLPCRWTSRDILLCVACCALRVRHRAPIMRRP